MVYLKILKLVPLKESDPTSGNVCADILEHVYAGRVRSAGTAAYLVSAA